MEKWSQHKQPVEVYYSVFDLVDKNFSNVVDTSKDNAMCQERNMEVKITHLNSFTIEWLLQGSEAVRR